MKKLTILFILMFMFISNTKAERFTVTLDNCIDGDTISVNFKNEKIKLRFLAVDAPEIKEKESYAEEAKDFTCTSLKNAKKIEVEYDENSDILDKYSRHLVWVWTDNILLQNELIKYGYAKVAYLYNDYKYTYILKESEKNAKKYNVNIWSLDKEQNKNDKDENKKSIMDKIKEYYEYIIVLLGMILALITYYKKIKKKISSK